jgi:CDP-glucose 4,6-dehydratase
MKGGANLLFWRDRPVFVTGGPGLVGSAVVEELVKGGARVICLWHDWVPDSELVRSDVFNKIIRINGAVEDQALMERILGEYEVTTVIHLAAQAIVGTAQRNPVSTFESNIKGTWSLLEACRRSPLVKHIVVASSDKAYGDQPTLPYTEDMPLLAKNPYDVSKACADMIAQSYAMTWDTPITIARCGNFFGEGDLNWSRIVPGTIRSIIRGEAPQIRSNGKLIRDYFYVRDGAHAYVTLAEQMEEKPEIRGHAFNFSTDKPMNVLELTDQLLKLMGSDLKPVVLNQTKGEIENQHLSSAKARKLLGWEPQYSMEEGLKKTVEWYKSILN